MGGYVRRKLAPVVMMGLLCGVAVVPQLPLTGHGAAGPSAVDGGGRGGHAQLPPAGHPVSPPPASPPPVPPSPASPSPAPAAPAPPSPTSDAASASATRSADAAGAAAVFTWADPPVRAQALDLPPPPLPPGERLVPAPGNKCALMTGFMNWAPYKGTTAQARGHLTRVMCGLMELARSHGRSHYIFVLNESIVKFLKGMAGAYLPHNVVLASEKDRKGIRFRDMTTVRLDDDDFLDVAYIDQCCMHKGRNFVLFPGNALYYNVKEGVYQDLQKFGRNFRPWSFGICVGPNGRQENALSKVHDDWGKHNNGYKQTIVPSAFAYYVRHGGNTSPRKEPFDPKGCTKPDALCAFGPPLSPNCSNFSITDAQVAEFERLLKKGV